ncbi:MAG: glycosyltransferase family 1 protein [Bacteroidota bacterium]
MKIAVNTRFLLKDRLEGIGRVTFELCKRLVDQHPEDKFLFLFDRPYDPAFIFGEQVSAKVVYPPARHPFLWYAWFEWAIPPILSQWKADVFLSPDNYCSLRTDCKTVMICHDLAHLHHPDQIPSLVRRYYDHYVPLFLAKADHIAAVSQYTKEDIIQQYDIPAHKITWIPNACRDIFSPLAEAEKAQVRAEQAQGQEYFFYAGAVHPRKNVDGLIRAFDRFKEETQAPHQLLLGGRWAWQTGPVKSAYDEAIHKKDIHFLGFLSEEQLARLMGAAFALVYVSHFEGFGLPVLEAMNCDTPVITSTNSSLPEVAGAAALLVDAHSIQQISEAMVRLYRHPSMRDTLIEKGRLQRKKFDWDRSTELLYQVLDGAVKEG